jgi:hypothetical protein
MSGLAPRTPYHYRVTAQNSAGQVVGQDLTFTTPADVTAPQLLFTVPRAQHIRVVRRRGIAFSLSTSEPCVARVRVLLDRRAAKRLGLPRLIGSAKLKLAPAATTPRFRVRLSRRARAAMPHSRRLRATLRAAATDPSHNRRVVTRRTVFSP